jgi:hypothetical protein
MKSLSAAILIGLSSTALAQQEAIEVGKAMAEQLKPYTECLKTEVAKITKDSASSREQAQQIVQEACAELRDGLKPKLLETIQRILNPVPPSVNPDTVADGALRMAQVGVYYDFTGEVRAIHERMKKRDEERLTRPAISPTPRQ